MKHDELREYKVFGLPLLKLMGLLAVMGIAATLVLHHIA